MPTSIDVEPIDTCNFACDHCQVTHWTRKTTRLTTERFISILRQLPMLRQVKLQGMGEPLLNRHLIEMLEAGETGRGRTVSIVTNGSIYTEKIARRLGSLRGTRITISMDGATAETFEAIRVNGNFQKVVDNVADMVRRRGRNVWPGIELRAVITRRNAHELPDLVRLAKRLGVDKLTATTLLTDWGKEEMEESIAPVDVSREDPQVDQGYTGVERSRRPYRDALQRRAWSKVFQGRPVPLALAEFLHSGQRRRRPLLSDSRFQRGENGQRPSMSPSPISGTTPNTRNCVGALPATTFPTIAAVATE